MITLSLINLFDYKPNIKNINITKFIPIHRMLISNIIDREDISLVLQENLLIQLISSFWVGNSIKKGLNINIYQHEASPLSLFLNNKTTLSLPSLFENAALIINDKGKAVGYSIQGMKEETFDHYLVLKENNLLNQNISNIFKFPPYAGKDPQKASRLYSVNSDDKSINLEVITKDIFIQYLINQCLFIGECAIPLRGFKEEEIIKKDWLISLTKIFMNVILETTDEEPWITRNIIVSDLYESILNLTNETGNKCAKSIGFIE